MTNLENFIHMHRQEFDVYQPGPELWAGISSGLAASVTPLKAGKIAGMGSKNLFLIFAMTSALLAVGTWAYKADQQETDSAPVIQHIEAPEEPVLSEQITAPNKEKEQEPLNLINEIPLNGGEPAHSPEAQTSPPPATGNSIPPLFSAAESGDSFYTGVKVLRLNTAGYNFRIKRSDSKTTRVKILKSSSVTITNREKTWEGVLKIEQRGSELVFQYDGPESRKGWGVSHEVRSTGEIEILIPDNEISLITSISSNICLEDYSAQSLNIETISGNLRVSDVKGRLHLSSTSGDQELSSLSGDLQSYSVSGDISLKKLSGNLKIYSTSGDVTLFNVRGNVNGESVSGDITMNEIYGRLDLHSVSGDIKGESLSLIESCMVKNVSGNIDLALKNSADELNFDLSSLSGSLKIRKGNTIIEGKKTVRAGSGKIPVKAETTSGDQLYR